jgi:hypothetical protein
VLATVRLDELEELFLRAGVVSWLVVNAIAADTVGVE